MVTERIPPHNLEAEQSILGSLLIDQESIVKIADLVRPQDFYKSAHAKIFEIIIELYERHEPIDLLSVGNRLDERGILKEVGGRTYIAELTNAVATSGNVVHHAKIVQKKATLRRMITTAGEIMEYGFNEVEDVQTLLDRSEQKLFNISTNFLQKTFAPIRSVLTGAFERIDRLHKNRGELRGLPTGFK